MKIKIVRMGSRGQVTIPQEFREELKLKTGEKMIFFKENGKLILEPMKDIKNLEKLKEELEFARRTEEAWKAYDRGEFVTRTADEFLKEMKKW